MSTRQARQGFGERTLVIGLDAGRCERVMSASSLS